MKPKLPQPNQLRLLIHIILLLGLFAVACSPPPIPSPPPATAEVETPQVSALPAGETPSSPAVPTATTTPLPPTPTATTSPTATVTPIPPSPTPTPTPEVDVLAEGERLLRNGDFRGAADTFQAFIGANPDHAQRGQATLGLGRAQLLDGQGALGTLTLALLSADAAYVEDHPEVYYWLGRAYGEIGQAEEADKAFSAYAERRPLLADWAHWRAGNAFMTTLNASQAITSYTQALNATEELIMGLRAREGIAAASIRADDPSAAISQYETILAIARNPGYRAEMLYELGRAQLAAGEPDAAYASFLQAMQTDPGVEQAPQALDELTQADREVDALLQGRVKIEAEAYQSAINILYDYLNNTPGHDGEAHKLAAEAFEGLGNYDGSGYEWRQILETHPGDRLSGEAWLGWARSLWRQDDPAAARNIYLRAVSEAPDAETAAAALWWASIIAEQDEDNLITAALSFAQLASTYPESDYADPATFRAGLTYYRLGDLAAAQEQWQSLAQADKKLWSGAADFWLGRAILAAEGEEAAVAHWQAMAERTGSDTYYGLRAAEEVTIRNGPALVPGGMGPAESDTLEAVISWLRTWVPELQLAGLDAPPSDLNRPIELHRVGEREGARAAFEVLRLRWQEDPVRLLHLALTTRDLGYYDTSIRAAARMYSLSPTAFTDLPVYLQKLIYPLYFSDIILPAAEKYGIDPYLFFGLIRQESLFGAIATSTAAARGLAQIIPSTGRSIAEQLNFPNYETELLYRPYINVDFGAFYLAQGLERSDGNAPQAMAGYNGGPGNAAFWRTLSGADDDLFLELVSFPETQTYLRVIPVQANHYRRLYPQLSTGS